MSLSKIKIKKTAQSLIGHFDPEAKLSVEPQDSSWRINVESEISAMLIGRHGQTLQALEHLLRMMVAQAVDEYSPVVVDVSGYRALREKEISEMAETLAKKVLESGESEDLPPMNSYERRIVHMVLTEIEGIETESMGEEPYRKIVIKKRQSR